MRLALAMNAVSAFRNDERHGRYRLTAAIGTNEGGAQAMPAQVDHWYSLRMLHGSYL